MLGSDLNDTIVAISTPIGEGGIGIVRMSGGGAVEIADMVFKSSRGGKPSEAGTYTMHYGHIVDRASGAVIDEVILSVMKAPKSYTKEDVVEINCHGGIQAVGRVMDLAVKCGARIAEPGEFTRRAFLNGRIDLTQAEAVIDVIRARTEGSLKVAMGALEGDLAKSVNGIREEIIDLTAQVEAAIDFSEEDIELTPAREFNEKVASVIRRIEKLLKSYDSGMVFREGVLAIICGKPNVGKSSLMNLLLKRDRVIVSPIPGTTRDAVEEMINLGGVPMRVVDTAGISQTKDALEIEGVRKSKSYLEKSDIVILVMDASTPVEPADEEMLRLVSGKKKLIVVNKMDAADKKEIEFVKKRFGKDKVVEISVKNKLNIDSLEDAIRNIVLSGSFDQGEGAVVSNSRHKEALDKAHASMLSVKKAIEEGFDHEIIAIDLKEAAVDLGHIVGKSVSLDILDRIFGQFCVGK